MKELTYGRAIMDGGTAFNAAVPPPHSALSAWSAGGASLTGV
jgi:hypothetical protein